jgi:hypothetical protein
MMRKAIELNIYVDESVYSALQQQKGSPVHPVAPACAGFDHLGLMYATFLCISARGCFQDFEPMTSTYNIFYNDKMSCLNRYVEENNRFGNLHASPSKLYEAYHKSHV